MIVISRDNSWIDRLRKIALREHSPFEVQEQLSRLPTHHQNHHHVLIVDWELLTAPPSRTIAHLRKSYPNSTIALACSDSELGVDAMTMALTSGAEMTIVKSWPQERLSSALNKNSQSQTHETVRMSKDGELKIDRRSQRVFVFKANQWKEVSVPALQTILLWRLLTDEGRAVSRIALLEELRSTTGREMEIQTISRHLTALRQSLSLWGGRITLERGGYYRLLSSSSRRRSMT